MAGLLSIYVLFLFVTQPRSRLLDFGQQIVRTWCCCAYMVLLCMEISNMHFNITTVHSFCTTDGRLTLPDECFPTNEGNAHKRVVSPYSIEPCESKPWNALSAARSAIRLMPIGREASREAMYTFLLVLVSRSVLYTRRIGRSHCRDGILRVHPCEQRTSARTGQRALMQVFGRSAFLKLNQFTALSRKLSFNLLTRRVQSRMHSFPSWRALARCALTLSDRVCG